MTVRFSTSPPEVRTRWSCAGDHRRRYEVICHFSGSRVLSKQTNHRRMTKQSPDLVTSLLTWFTIFTWRHGQSWRHDPAEQQLMCNISGLISSSCHAVDHCCQDPDTTPPQVPDTDPTQDSDNPDTDPPQNPDTDPTQDPDTDPPQDPDTCLPPVTLVTGGLQLSGGWCGQCTPQLHCTLVLATQLCSIQHPDREIGPPLG